MVWKGFPAFLAAQLCPTLYDPMDCSLPGSAVHGILHPPGFLNSLPTKPILYVGSMGARRQSVGRQTSGARHFLKPSHLTENLLQELHLACGLPVRSTVKNKLLGSRYQCAEVKLRKILKETKLAFDAVK